MDQFADALIATCSAPFTQLAAWCLLPNHFHLLVETMDLRAFTTALGKLHGRSARAWNLNDGALHRKVFHRSADRHIRSEAHFWATLNYIQHNPVRHQYVEKWTDWPWSSAHDYLRSVGRTSAAQIWRAYPVREYGEGWDAPHR